MTKKKSGTQKKDEGNANGNGHVPDTGSVSSPSSSTLSLPMSQMLISSNNTNPADPSPVAPASTAPAQKRSQSALIICRNKHWRYISAYHGPWLQLPPEVLENLAHLNYNTPRPRPIDPAVFFDVSKIRRLVEQATDLSTRAASGVVTSNNPPGMTSGLHQAAALGIGPGFRPGNHKISAERRYRMREQATQKLAKAYRLDEIACSVNIMQSTSSLEDVAQFVLQRNPRDSDAKYVHFFHEKIPSRQLAECTDYEALNDVIQDRPRNPEPLRTRGTVRIFKEDFQGAIADYTEALRTYRSHSHVELPPDAEQQLVSRLGGRHEDVFLKEEEHPSSLETSVLFQRAGVYLSIACHHAASAFPTQETSESEISPEALEARKLVRTNAKRALRDYTAYLSRFEYSPNLPLSITHEFVRRTNLIMHGAKDKARKVTPPNGAETTAHRIYTVAELFASSPPSDLVPYPNTEVAIKSAPGVDVAITTETLTYHPLMTEALHCLLICHCLMQTSAKELLRHAYMVARLARLSDGYPAFQTSRSPARSDWIEILRAANNWIQLSGTWEDLCRPAPVPFIQSGPDGTISSYIPHEVGHSFADNTLVREAQALTLPAHIAETPSSMATVDRVSRISASRDELRRQHEQHQIMLDALGDDRVKDEESFRRSVRARQLRAERDYRIDSAVRYLDQGMIRKQAAAAKQGQLEDGTSTTTTTSTLSAAAVADNSTLAGNSTTPVAGGSSATPVADDSAPAVIGDSTPPTTGAAAAAAAVVGNSTPPAAGAAAAAAAPAAANANATTNVTANAGANATATVTLGEMDGSAAQLALARAAGLARYQDDTDYPISTDRATAVARWVLEAPANAGVVPGEKGGAKKKKKKPLVRKKSLAESGGGGGGGVVSTPAHEN